MNFMEIILLIAGAVIFAASFILPERKKMIQPETQEILKNEIQNMVAEEMDSVRSRIDSIVDETVSYAVEKTERSMERLSNEKIMAVNEYSDTVLDEIHQNHEEVIFLYDMLNSKQKNIKKTVREVEKTVKEVEQTVKETESSVKEATVEEAAVPSAELNPLPVKKVSAQPANKKSTKKTEKTEEIAGSQIGRTSGSEEAPEVDLSFMESPKSKGRNNNEVILSLHKDGKSNVAIAKELGLGIGEVKLVIDLFEGV